MYIFTQTVNIFKDTTKNIQSFPLTAPNREGWEPFSVKNLLKTPQGFYTGLTVYFNEVWKVIKLFI